MLSDKNKEHIQAAVFRRLVEHLQKNTEIQNIDLMNLAGFCRNCLSKWTVEEAKKLIFHLSTKMLERIFMEWNIQNGKKNIRHQ